MTIGVWPYQNDISCFDSPGIEDAIDDSTDIRNRPDLCDRVLCER